SYSSPFSLHAALPIFELVHFVLDAPRHDVGAPRQLAGRPDRLIDEVLLDVGEAGDGATLDQRVAVGQSGVAKYGDAVAQRGGDRSEEHTSELQSRGHL